MENDDHREERKAECEVSGPSYGGADLVALHNPELLTSVSGHYA